MFLMVPYVSAIAIWPVELFSRLGRSENVGPSDGEP